MFKSYEMLLPTLCGENERESERFLLQLLSRFLLRQEYAQFVVGPVCVCLSVCLSICPTDGHMGYCTRGEVGEPSNETKKLVVVVRR